MRAYLLLFALVLSFSGSALAFKLTGAVWDPDTPVRYNLEPSGSDDISDGSDLEAVRNAFRSWGCVPGVSIRFVEGRRDGVKDVALDDGLNSIFWDETGEFGLGPATLGVNFGPTGTPEEPVVRTASIIIFNGADHTWSTSDSPGDKTDVESIAIHETGHWIGLDHSCNGPGETDCLAPSESVMNPAYPGGLLRKPEEDDIAGIRSLYPSEDESTCTGPFRQGEFCSCNGECVGDLLCVPAQNGDNVCSPTCNSQNVICPAGFLCVLGAVRGESAPGVCVQIEEEGAPQPYATPCSRDADCDGALCDATVTVGRTVCRKSCDAAAECGEGYTCTEGMCVGVPRDIPCPDEPQPECGCSVSSSRSTLWGAALGVLAFLLWRRRS